MAALISSTLPKYFLNGFRMGAMSALVKPYSTMHCSHKLIEGLTK